MGVDVMVVGVHMRKALIFTLRSCYRSACAHPFIVVIGVFIFLLYRYFPCLFSFLLSSSPVIFCTAVLLGALLSFGNPNIPEVEEEEDDDKTKTTHHEISALKTGVVERDFVVEKDESFEVEARVEKKEEVVLVEERDADRNSVVEEGVLENHQEEELQKEVMEKREINEEKSAIEDEEEEDDGGREIRGFQVENSRPESELPGTHLEDPFGASQWKLIKDQDESSDSESDGGESSSPDASMADILPMLDELHPLLDSEPPQPIHASHGDSDGVYVSSDESSVSSSEEEEEEEEEEEVEREEEEEEKKLGGKDDGTEAVVTWTEDDEKNLMDLGNSELERNRRLESLIARRRARKNLRTMVVEKNLIDLDGVDPPFQIAPISTARRNPFDLHYDSNEGMGLPPIPGSAPSVMFPRRNPFDLPYGPFEERPNLSGGSFEEEFLTGHEKDMYFRRHESFSYGSSFFAESKQEFNFRPYFTTEQASPEKMGFPPFQRQMGERNDAKLTPLTEMESLSSFIDQHNQKNFIEREISRDGDLIPHSGHVPDHDKAESTSSKEVHVGDIDREDERDSDADDESACEREFTLLDTESISGMKPDVVEKDHSGSNSSSSGGEETFQEKMRDGKIEESNLSVQPAVVDTIDRDIVAVEVDDSHMKGPVYDWNPIELEKTLSGMTIIEEALFYENKGVLTSSSRASEMNVDRESSLHNEGPGKELISSNEGQWVASSHVSAVEENETRSKEVTLRMEDVINVGFSEDGKNSDEHIVPGVPVVVEPVLSSSSSSSETDSQYERRMSEQQKLHEILKVPSSSSSPVDAGPPRFDIDEVDHNVSDSGVSSEVLTHFASENLPPSLDGDAEEFQEPSSLSPVLSKKEADVITNSQEVPVHEHESNDSSDLSVLGADPSLVLSEVSENILPTVSDGDLHAGIQYAEDSEEATGIHVTDQEFDVGEELKEIDERLLTELDAVGDFSVEELRTNTTKTEMPLEGEVQEILSELQVPEANSTLVDIDDSSDLVGAKSLVDLPNPLESGVSTLEDKYDSSYLVESEAFVDLQKPLESGVSTLEDKSDSSDLVESEAFVDLQKSLVSGVVSSTVELEESSSKSVEDTSSTYKKLHEEVDESSTIEHDGPKLEEAEGGNPQVRLVNQDLVPTKTDLEVPVLETRSFEPTDSTYDQLHKEESGKSIALEPTHSDPILDESDTQSAESKLASQDENVTESSSELPVLEARSLHDIVMGFNQVQQEEDEKLTALEPVQNEVVKQPEESGEPIALETTYSDAILEESDTESAESKLASEEQNLTQSSSELPVLEARSLQDIVMGFDQVQREEAEKLTVLEPIHNDTVVEQTGVSSIEVEMPNQDSSQTENTPELPVLEAQSIGDVDSSLKQLDEESKKPIVLESIHEDQILEDTKVDSHMFKVLNQEPNPTESSLEILDLQARSLDGIGSSLHDKSISKETKAGSAEFDVQSEDPNPAGTSLELSVLEASSLEDIHAAFKQFHEEEVKEPVVLDSVPDESMLEETKVTLSELERPIQDPNPSETGLELPEIRREDTELAYEQFSEGEVQSAISIPSDTNANLPDAGLETVTLEARSLEHIDLASMQLHEGDQEKHILPESVEGHLEKPVHHESVDEVHHDIPTLPESVEGHHETPVPPESVDEDHHDGSNLPESVEGQHEKSMFHESVEEDHHDRSLIESVKGHDEKPVLHESIEEDHHDRPMLSESVEGHDEKPDLHESVEVDHRDRSTLSESVGHDKKPVLHESVEGDHHDRPMFPESVEGHDEKPVLHESVEDHHDRPTLCESSEEHHERSILDESVEEHHDRLILKQSVESKSSLDIHTDSQAPEATHEENAHSTPKQLSEDKMEDLVNPTESEDGSTGLSAKESVAETKLDMEDSVTQETNEASNSSRTDVQKKKKGSGKSSSSSSSSSSDSD